MITKWLDTLTEYDGSQLRWDFGYRLGIPGNSILLFRGPAKVSDHLVDLEDALHEDYIYSPDMIHILITKFHEPLITAIHRQRFAMWALANLLNNRLNLFATSLQIKVHGDDLLILTPPPEGTVSDNILRKLSVSIATTSGHATVTHIGVNVVSPEKSLVKVPTIGLEEIAR